MGLALGVMCLAVAASPLASSDDRVGLILIGETDYRVQSAEVEGLNGFSLARFRLGARAQPKPWFRAVGTVEWANEKPALNDAYFQLLPLESLRVTIGYSKTPLFITAKDEHVEALAIPDRSLVVLSFWPRRDLGAEVNWSPANAPIEAWARFGNGFGSPLGNDNMSPSGDLRVDLTLGRERRGMDPLSKWGLRFGVGAHGEEAFDRQGIAGTTSHGFLFYRPPVVSGPRLVSEAHLAASYGQFRLLIEAGTGWESRSRDTDGNSATPRESLPTLQSRGAAVELSYVLRGLPREGSDWPKGDPSPEGSDEWTGGSLEIAGRFERLWLGLKANDVEPGGVVGGATALRWWVNDFFGVGVAGYVLRYDRPPLEEPTKSVGWLALARTTVKFR